jgi:uncharacterized protein
VTDRFCAECGHPHAPTDRFCAFCGTPQPDPEPFVDALPPGVPWRAWDGLWIWLIATLATIVIAVPLEMWLSKDAANAGLIFANELLLVVAVIVWIRRRYRVGLSALGLRGSIADVGVGVGFGFLGYLAAAIIGGVLIEIVQSVVNHAVEQPEQIPIDGPISTPLLALIGVSVVIIAPIAEEMLFRGIIFKGLRNWAKPGAAFLLSALFFAVAHLYPLIIPPIFVLGILLAMLVERRGSLVASIAAHITFNSIGFAFLVASQR